MAEAQLRDERGNPVQLTDQFGNPVKLTDEHGNPVRITGIAASAAHPTSAFGTYGGTGAYGGGATTGTGTHGIGGGPTTTTTTTVGDLIGSDRTRQQHLAGDLRRSNHSSSSSVHTF